MRTSLEPRFGHSFEQVRVYPDVRVGAMLAPLGAMAATVDGDIFVRPELYAPGTPAGRYLLAHELAHVVQSRTHGLARSPMVSLPDHASEREATAAADAVTAGFDAPALSAAAAPVAPMFAQTPLRGLEQPWPDPALTPVPPIMSWPSPGPGMTGGFGTGIGYGLSPVAPWLPPPVIMGGGQSGGGMAGSGSTLERMGQGVRGLGSAVAGPVGGLAGGIADAGKAVWDFLTGW